MTLVQKLDKKRVVSWELVSYHLTSNMDSTSLCQDCGLTFTEKWQLKEHVRIAHDERVIQCDTCPMQLVGLMKMKLPITLKIHVIVDHYSDY